MFYKVVSARTDGSRVTEKGAEICVTLCVTRACKNVQIADYA
jgi:hypothetical protein